MTKFYSVAGWLALACVVFVTLSPISDRPEITMPHLEHFVAFFVLGLVFVLAYRNQIAIAVLIVVGSAIALEVLQLVTPDRHGRLIDVLVKIGGGLCGIGLSWLARLILQTIFRRASTQLPGPSSLEE